MADRYASLKQGLVGCWIPSISGSGLLLPDLSGRGNNGALTNMDASDWVSSQYGRALRINRAATRDQVNFGNVCHQPNDFSVSFFVNKIATGSTAYQNLWAVTRWNTGASMGTNEFCCLLTKDSTGTGDEPSFVVDIAGTGYRVESSAALRLGFFDHVCCVRLADTLSIYVNSINRGTTTGVPTTAIANNSRNLKLGDSDIASTDLSTNAMFNDIRIYSRALTDSEIRLLASEPGIGFKPAKKLSRFSQRFTYKPAKPRNYSVIRNRDPNYSTLRQGLVAAYCPSISGQGNVLPDLVGGNHGTLTNMTADDWVSSGDGRALDFGDSNDVVSIGKQLPNISGQAELTIAMWAKRNTATGVAAVGQADTSDPGNNGYWHINVWQDGNAYFQVYPNFVGIADNSTTWNFWLLTLKNSQIKGYRNGVEVASTSGPASVPAVNGNFQIGKYWINTATNSQLDDIRVYNRALTESEIKLLASKRGIGLEPRKPKITFTDLGVQKTYSVVRVKETDYGTLRQGLVGAWCPSLPNGGSGNTLPDVSGYGNHGVLTNMSPDDWVSGQYGRALDFDGVNDFLDYGRCDQLSGLGVLSCSFWCYPKSANEMYGLIRYNTTIALGSERRADYFGIQATGGVLYPVCYFSLAGNVTFFQSFTSTSLPVAQNNWSHIAFSVNLAGNTATIAVNGVSVAGTRSSGGTPPTATAAQGTVTWRSQTYIGSGGTQFYFDGQIDDLRTYNRALSEPEIKLLASRPGIGLRQESHRNTFYQFPSGARRKRILTGMP